MEKMYKLRAIPLAIGLLTLAIGFALHLCIPATEMPIIRYGAWMTVVGIIFLQIMRQLKKERQMEQPPVEAPPNIQRTEFAHQEYKHKNVMPFFIVRAVLSLIISLLGISLIFDGQWIWGIILFLFGCGLCFLHIYWIRRNIRELKTLENAKNNDDSYE